MFESKARLPVDLIDWGETMNEEEDEEEEDAVDDGGESKTDNRFRTLKSSTPLLIWLPSSSSVVT